MISLCFFAGVYEMQASELSVIWQGDKITRILASQEYPTELSQDFASDFLTKQREKIYNMIFLGAWIPHTLGEDTIRKTYNAKILKINRSDTQQQDKLNSHDLIHSVKEELAAHVIIDPEDSAITSVAISQIIVVLKALQHEYFPRNPINEKTALYYVYTAENAYKQESLSNIFRKKLIDPILIIQSNADFFYEKKHLEKLTSLASAIEECEEKIRHPITSAGD